MVIVVLILRETARCSGNISDLDVLKSNQPLSSLTVSSNFEKITELFFLCHINF
ncbi:hypothetical protein OIU76_016404 [Salix suchowensis]|nr:hypothetical protein OIU76_016404 [Salix suchowensis]